MSKEQRTPVIQQALGEEWHELSTIIKLHYALAPGGESELHLKGKMVEVYHSWIGKLFLIPGRIFGALVPYKGFDIPTEIKNWTSRNNQHAMYWYRKFSFPGRRLVIFQSRMEHHRGSEIIEYVGYGMGIRLHTFTKEGALHFHSIGFVWKIGPFTFHIPNWAILGDAEIVERAISEEELFVDFNMKHPLFGKTFSYSGRFFIDNQASG